MPMTLEQIVEESRKLPPDQLSELIERITLAAHGSIDPAIDQAWQEEVRRRLAEIDSGKAELIPGEVTRAKVRKIVAL